MNKPVQLLSAIGIITCCSLFSCGGNGNAVVPTPEVTEKAISLKIENGTSLSYKVSPSEMVNYTLDITFRELEPKLSFDFVLTNMDYTKGSVEIAETAKKTSHTHTNQFSNGKTILTDKTNMVLSSDVYRDLLETGNAKINWEGENVDFKVVKNEDFNFEKGNAHIIETVMLCANENKSHQFWVWKNPELPLLMRVAKNEKPVMELTYWYLPGERQ